METHPAEPLLSPIEARVLGCLLEKRVTTPEYYPLTLNSLTNACNQKSNRDPVMSVGETEVKAATESLRRKNLVVLFAGADTRVPKFKESLDQVMPLDPAQRAVLCELLLRGPQTLGELRNRADRMHPFADLSEVEAALQALENRQGGPLVERLARQPGQKEPRFAQLLSAPPAPSADHLPSPAAGSHQAASDPEARLRALEEEVVRLRQEVAELRRQVDAAPTPSAERPA